MLRINDSSSSLSLSELISSLQTAGLRGLSRLYGLILSFSLFSWGVGDDSATILPCDLLTLSSAPERELEVLRRVLAPDSEYSFWAYFYWLLPRLLEAYCLFSV